MTNDVVTKVVEGLRYRGKSGQWSWIFHRIAGLGTVFFLLLHIVDTATVYFFPDHYQTFIDLYRTPVFGVLEIVLVACLLYHGLNGLRITLFDLTPGWWTIERQARAATYVAVTFAVLMVPVVVVMGSNILQHLGGG